MSKSGHLIVIVAPSGTGKSTLIKRIKKEFPELEESVSCTTRPKRPGEEEGVDYFYLTEEDFLARKKANDFLEWAEVHSNYYGTSRKVVDDCLDRGTFLLFDLDIQGADAIKQHYAQQSDIIFIEPPSIEELEKRLRGRGTESEESIQIRLENARKEIQRKDDYDHVVVNEEIEQAYRDLKAIFSKIIRG